MAAYAAGVGVTVENGTRFCEFTSIRPASVLAIFTGGFASPLAIMLLQSIGAARPGVLFMHLRDLDAGSSRILAHLRGKLRTVAPLAMEPARFETFCVHPQRLNANVRAALEQRVRHPRLAVCTVLIQRLLATNRKLELEAVDSMHWV